MKKLLLIAAIAMVGIFAYKIDAMDFKKKIEADVKELKKLTFQLETLARQENDPLEKALASANIDSLKKKISGIEYVQKLNAEIEQEDNIIWTILKAFWDPEGLKQETLKKRQENTKKIEIAKKKIAEMQRLDIDLGKIEDYIERKSTEKPKIDKNLKREREEHDKNLKKELDKLFNVEKLIERNLIDENLLIEPKNEKERFKRMFEEENRS